MEFAERAVRVTAGSRLHLGLINMGPDVSRIEGGVGIALDSPRFDLSVSFSDRFDSDGNDEERERLVRYFGILQSRFSVPPVFVRVHERVPLHAGFGAGTQLALAYAAAHLTLCGISTPVRDMAQMLGRGGTSGIGVAAFEQGGLIVDGGHHREQKVLTAPSGASLGIPPAVPVVRLPFPSWPIILIYPPSIRGLHGNTESQHFRRNARVSRLEMADIAHTILMGLLPSVAECRLDEFIFHVSKLRRSSWKRAEIDLHPMTKLLIEELELNTSAAVMLSSMGPGIGIVATSPKSVLEVARDFSERMKIDFEIQVTASRQHGANITHITG